jgi:chromosome segregation ATPase
MSTLDSDNLEKPAQEPSRRWLPIVAVVLGLGVVGSVAALFQQNAQLVAARAEVSGLRREISVVRQDVGAAEARLREKFETLNTELSTTREQTQRSVDRARLLARKQAEALISKSTTSQEEKHNALAAELGRLKDTADQATVRLTSIGSEVGDVKTEVGDVKTQVASTRTELEKAITEMRRVNGDLGVMSGLIATNSKEIGVLRSLGERDYYEFSLTKKQAQRLLAGVNLIYKKADTKRNRFTMDVVADDKRVQKKDRGINEPIQFYVSSKARQPYEIVINEIKKDTITGYLSTPKTQVAQR